MATIAEALAVALEYHRAGNLHYAEQVYRQVLQADPTNADTLHLLGLLLHHVGRQKAAIACLKQALATDPGVGDREPSPRPASQGDDEAAAGRRAPLTRPARAEAYNDLGIAYAHEGKFTEALRSFERALGLDPGSARFVYNIGLVFRARGDFSAAAQSFAQAITCWPNYVDAHLALGNALFDLGRLDEAVASYREAIRLEPGRAGFHANVGNVLLEQGQVEQALACYDRAAELEPGCAMFRWNRALALLLLGDLERGWPEFEWRLEFEPLGLKRTFVEPRWDGGDLDGGTLLLHAEGGFGDALQFIRYAPLAARRVARVLLECQPELRSLLRGVAGLSGIVGHEERLPAFDVQTPLQSLPLAFGTVLDTIPDAVPYLTADPQRERCWRARLADDRGGLRVGLVWSGKPKASARGNPACPFPHFRALARAEDVSFYSLQLGDAAAEARQPDCGLTLHDWTSELHEFADTAALVANLDLVISVDTSVVHLAGALGKPVWVLLLYCPDFRWLLERDDSPWYPSMRLFRQRQAGDWKELLERVAGALARVSAAAEAGCHTARV